jgi:hypothetical protein
MQLNLRAPLFVSIMVLSVSMLAAQAVSDSPPDGLASVESFSSIADTAARSATIFTELGKVLTHPRCLNCHPAGDRPRQGDVARLHQPPVERGADGFGLPACAVQSATCRPTSTLPACRGILVGISRPEKWDGKARPWARSARRSRIQRATETVQSTRSLSILAKITWSVGLGRPDMADSRLPARRSRRARSSRPGLKPGRSVPTNRRPSKGSFLNHIVALGISDVRWFAEAPGSPGSSPAQPCCDRNSNFKQGLWTAEAVATGTGPPEPLAPPCIPHSPLPRFACSGLLAA